MTDLPTYVLERQFNAPAELVWRTWTDPELVPRWYGPGVDSIVHKMDVRKGGVWLHEMRWGGNSNFQRGDYTTVDPHTRLEWLHSVTDGEWEVIDNPMMPGWPRVLMTVVTFDETGSQTDMRLTWTPHDATEDERTTFAGAMAGLDKGWGSGMELLDKLLAELQA